jgi:hypothetical protein
MGGFPFWLIKEDFSRIGTVANANPETSFYSSFYPKQNNDW